MHQTIVKVAPEMSLDLDRHVALDIHEARSILIQRHHVWSPKSESEKATYADALGDVINREANEVWGAIKDWVWDKHPARIGIDWLATEIIGSQGTNTLEWRTEGLQTLRAMARLLMQQTLLGSDWELRSADDEAAANPPKSPALPPAQAIMEASAPTENDPWRCKNSPEGRHTMLRQARTRVFRCVLCGVKVKSTERKAGAQ